MCSYILVSIFSQSSPTLGRFSRRARISSGVVGMSFSRSRSSGFLEVIEPISHALTIKIIPDLDAVNSRQGQKEPDVGHVLKRSRRIVLHGAYLQRGDVLGLRHVDRKTAGSGLDPAGREELLARLAADVHEIEASPGEEIGMRVVRVTGGAVERLVPAGFQKADQIILNRGFDDEIEIQGRAWQSI